MWSLCSLALVLVCILCSGASASEDALAIWRGASYASSFQAMHGSVPSGSFERPARDLACAAAIATAEARYGLPKGLLRAIGDVESGRPVAGGTDIQPWPWTVNAQGQGLFFDTMQQAVHWVRQQQALGVASIDVGCLQINLFHHPTAFRSLETAFNPAANADFAAQFLLSLYRSTGNWTTAVGFYHSRTDTLADGYRQRVRTVLNDSRRADCRSGAAALQMAWQATLPPSDPRASTAGPPVAWSPAPADRCLVSLDGHRPPARCISGTPQPSRVSLLPGSVSCN
jgi:hypothetical protein